MLSFSAVALSKELNAIGSSIFVFSPESAPDINRMVFSIDLFAETEESLCFDDTIVITKIDTLWEYNWISPRYCSSVWYWTLGNDTIRADITFECIRKGNFETGINHWCIPAKEHTLVSVWPDMLLLFEIYEQSEWQQQYPTFKDFALMFMRSALLHLRTNEEELVISMEHCPIDYCPENSDCD